MMHLTTLRVSAKTNPGGLANSMEISLDRQGACYVAAAGPQANHVAIQAVAYLRKRVKNAVISDVQFAEVQEEDVTVKLIRYMVETVGAVAKDDTRPVGVDA